MEKLPSTHDVILALLFGRDLFFNPSNTICEGNNSPLTTKDRLIGICH
jgi:hypothetical protein